MNDMNLTEFDFVMKYFKIEILEHAYIQLNNSWDYKDITSPFNRLYFPIEGTGIIKKNSQSTVLEKNYAYLIPANSTYDYFCENNLNKIYIHFKTSFIPGFDIFSELSEILKLSFDETNTFSLIHCYNSNELASKIKLKSIILDVISSFIYKSNINFNKTYSDIIFLEPFLNYIEQHCSMNFNTDDMSKFFNITSSKLTREFKKHLNKTPNQFVNHLIIEKSKQKLMFDSETIKEIAYSFDFKDEYYFSRFFKKNVGVCPRTYRKNREIIL